MYDATAVMGVSPGMWYVIVVDCSGLKAAVGGLGRKCSFLPGLGVLGEWIVFLVES